MARILVIDDDVDFSQSFKRLIERLGHEVTVSMTLSAAFEDLQEGSFDLIFLDVNLPDGNGIAHIRQFSASPGLPEVIILTGDGDSDGAAIAITNGAWDYVEKPMSPNNIKLTLQRALAYRNAKQDNNRQRQIKRDRIIGNSAKIRTCIDLMSIAANSRLNVVITGETGTGKELFARGIHENSPTAASFIVIDCTNIPKELTESILFGHTKGSFTNAHESRDGLFKLADKGTVFLDEIGELDLDQQRSLLRVLQERKFRPVGSDKEVSSTFRVIAATNRNLKEMIAQGHFRSDLYHRLNGHHIHVPNLAERSEDIRELAEHYAAKVCQEYKVPAKEISTEYLAALYTHTWPGNIRELINCIYVSVDNAYDETGLYRQHLPLDIRINNVKNSFKFNPEKLQPEVYAPGTPPTGSIPLILGPDLPPIKEIRENVVGHMEQRYLSQLIKICGTDVPMACQRSGLSRARLYELLKKHSMKLK